MPKQEVIQPELEPRIPALCLGHSKCRMQRPLPTGHSRSKGGPCSAAGRVHWVSTVGREVRPSLTGLNPKSKGRPAKLSPGSASGAVQEGGKKGPWQAGPRTGSGAGWVPWLERRQNILRHLPAQSQVWELLMNARPGAPARSY